MLPDLRIALLPASVPQADLTDPDGYMKLLPAAELDALPRASVRVWAHHQARYHLPTLETVEWLRAFIGDRKAIEIGSGAGDLAWRLGIPGTDNRCQELSEVAAYYEAIQQPTIRYPSNTVKMDALTAVRCFKPQVVLAAWVTHWINPNKPPPKHGGSVYGVHEDKIIRMGVTYVLIGNLNVHQYKPILRYPHRVIELPFLRSRGERSADRVFIWNAVNG